MVLENLFNCKVPGCKNKDTKDHPGFCEEHSKELSIKAVLWEVDGEMNFSGIYDPNKIALRSFITECERDFFWNHVKDNEKKGLVKVEIKILKESD